MGKCFHENNEYDTLVVLQNIFISISLMTVAICHRNLRWHLIFLVNIVKINDVQIYDPKQTKKKVTIKQGYINLEKRSLCLKSNCLLISHGTSLKKKKKKEV